MAVSREPEFRTTRMREGYDLDAVDDYVDLVIDALEGRSAGRSVTPEQIEGEEFKVVRMREGYVMDDVDDWLDAAAAELRRMRKAAQASAHDYSPPNTAVNAHAGPASAAHPVAPPVAPAAAPPAVAPPVGTPGYGAPMAAPAGNPTYPAYYETEHGSGHQATTGYATSPGTGPQATTGYASSPGTGTSYDPLTDSAVNELDPVLRALDPTYSAGEEQQYAQAAPAAAHSQETSFDDQSLSPSSTPSTGLHHVEIWVRDIDAATRSFGWLFERLGWTLFQAWENGRSWQAPGAGPYVVVECSPDLSWVTYDRKAPGLNHLALAVPEQWMVDRIVSEAPAYGWRLMFADLHPHAGGPQHYAAYMENDEGYEVEVVAP